MSGRRAVLLLLLIAPALSGCARRKPGEARPLASGDAVWLRDGVGANPSGVEDALLRSGFSAVYLPARTIRAEGETVTGSLPEPPLSPLTRIPVILVIESGEPLATSLRTAEGPGREALAASLGRVVQAAVSERQRFGKVAGIHLDIPFASDSLESFAHLVREVRRLLPPQYRLTASLRFSPTEESREALAEVEVDGWTVNVFGETGAADTLAVDTLGQPWWAVYSPFARGVWRAADGSVKETLGEGQLALLTDRPEVDLAHDLSWKEDWAAAYLMRPQRVVQAGGRSFAPGEVISFSHPSLPEMLSRLGADIAARRNARGRVIVLRGTSDAERIFSLAALGDVLLGRNLDPDLRVTVGPSPPRQVGVAVENATAHASMVSRTANWVEIEVPSPGVRDVAPGGFERYEVYDAQGRPVSLGRALRVRFYETLINPFERVEAARVTLRDAPPAGCCRWRSRHISAAGREITTDWAAPDPTPTASATPRAVR